VPLISESYPFEDENVFVSLLRTSREAFANYYEDRDRSYLSTGDADKFVFEEHAQKLHELMSVTCGNVVEASKPATHEATPMTLEEEAAAQHRIQTWLHNEREKAAFTLARQEEHVNAMQLDVLQHVTSISMEASRGAIPALKKRFEESLGFRIDECTSVLDYIRSHAPIIIHVHLDRLINAFLADTHYRNLFETSCGNGCTDKNTRKLWEDRLFAYKYSSAEPFDRVKYGVLNVSNDPAGVRSAYQYGDSYFLLRSERVRLRCTFADQDTGSASSILGMVEVQHHNTQACSVYSSLLRFNFTHQHQH